MNQPNILLILTDQQSAAAMSCVSGETWLHTPNLDRLAAGGTRFSSACTVYPRCVPARTSLLYGVVPHQLMHPGTETDMSGGRPGGPARGVRPRYAAQELSKVLQRAGYWCGYAGKWHVGTWGPTESLTGQDDTAFEALCPMDDHRLPETIRQGLQRPDDKPWFLVASFDNPHNIHEWLVESPLPWGNLPQPPALGELPPLPANYAPSTEEPCHLAGRRADPMRTMPTVEGWRRYRWAYNRLVERVDAQIGQVLDALDQNGQQDNTVVIFTSDHGDMQGAHGLPFKEVLYRESVEVPLLLRGPGIPVGRTICRPVNAMLDVYGTIVDLANAAPPEDVQGRSLLPLLQEFSESAYPDHAYAETHLGGVAGRMIRTQRYRYNLYAKGPNREQLFDLQDDPGEMVNLAGCQQYRQILQEHRQRLRNWCELTEDRIGGGHYTHPNTGFLLPGDEYGA
jgi:arylsulfatase A-like enzyme